MLHTFFDCLTFTGTGLSSWDTSNVQDMSQTFAGATLFAGDISSWHVSKVTTLYTFAYGCAAFNANLGAWDVSSVQDLEYAFYGTSSFQGTGLSSWDTSRVTSLKKT